MSTHRVVHTLTWLPLYSGRFEMGFQRVLQVDLKMESFPEPLGSRWMAWQVEYPASRTTTQEVETEIRLAQEDLAGIVPLAMVSQCHVPLGAHPQRQLHTHYTQCDIMGLVFLHHIILILNPEHFEWNICIYSLSVQKLKCVFYFVNWWLL